MEVTLAKERGHNVIQLWDKESLPNNIEEMAGGIRQMVIQRYLGTISVTQMTDVEFKSFYKDLQKIFPLAKAYKHIEIMSI